MYESVTIVTTVGKIIAYVALYHLLIAGALVAYHTVGKRVRRKIRRTRTYLRDGKEFARRKAMYGNERR